MISGFRAVICILGVVLILLIIDVAYNKHTELTTLRKQVALSKIDSLQFIQKTLGVAYGLSESEQIMYAKLFKNYAGNEWPLVAAVIQIESKYNPTLSSSSKARGLMQLLEGTMQEQCTKLNISYKENVTIWNEAINIRCGIAYLFESKNGGLELNTTEIMVKRYIGGITYIRAEKGGEREKVINDYYNAVMREYVKLQFIYKGVLK